ncbi:MAG: thiamine-phosphate kinase [Acidobacteriota bacterium]|nr:thiamine-phosphate kinase [Acidobacteriota bacterium]
MKSEFDLINKIRATSVLSKIGDDCAVLPKDSRTDLVITTDLLVEDIDFRLIWTRAQFLGHKALAVSLSDIAAMGAKPVWAMLSLGIPAQVWETDFVEKFYEGWFALAEKFGVELVGGDVSKTPDKIVIDSIVAGEVRKGKAVLRSTAQPNDLIFVTGELGGAAAGLQLLEKGEKFDKSKNEKLLLRQLKPQPQTEIGQLLTNLSTSMIDLSDGLSSDLAHICRESKVGAKIYAEKIPIDKNLSAISSENLDLLNFALNGGEDFELLFTVNPENQKKIFRLKAGLTNYAFSCIGEITKETEIIELISKSKTQILAAKGYRHF